MAKRLVWYTDYQDRGDSMEVEAETKDQAADWVLDHCEHVESVDNVELIG